MGNRYCCPVRGHGTGSRYGVAVLRQPLRRARTGGYRDERNGTWRDAWLGRRGPTSASRQQQARDPWSQLATGTRQPRAVPIQRGSASSSHALSHGSPVKDTLRNPDILSRRRSLPHSPTGEPGGTRCNEKNGMTSSTPGGGEPSFRTGRWLHFTLKSANPAGGPHPLPISIRPPRRGLWGSALRGRGRTHFVSSPTGNRICLARCDCPDATPRNGVTARLVLPGPAPVADHRPSRPGLFARRSRPGVSARERKVQRLCATR